MAQEVDPTVAAELVDHPSTARVADFDAFYRRSWPRFVRTAALLAQDQSVADEIAQEAFVQVLHRWDEMVDPSAYLYQCVVNGARTYHRRRRVVREKLTVLAGLSSADQEFGELADVVASLPFRQRAVIVLRYWCDLTENEIAATIGCRPGTVKSLSSRALARLSTEVPR